MQQYLESMTVNIPLEKRYEKLKNIKSRSPRRMNKLSINENLIVEKANIVNCLAEAFCESV